MPLYLDLAKQIYGRHSSEMTEWSDDKKMEYRKELVTQLKDDPSLSVVSAEVPDELVNQINKGEEAYAKKLDWFNRNTANTTEAYREKFMPQRWGGLKDLHRESDLSKQGVVLDRELPAGDLELGFGEEPVRALSGALNKYFNNEGYTGNVKVFKSGDDLIYVDPTDKRPVRVNPGWKGIVGQGIPIATEIAGTIAVTKGAGGPASMVAKESAAGGLSASVGELTRLLIGKALDAHDLSDKQIFEKSGVHGATSAAISAGVGYLLTAAKGLYNVRTGNIFNKTDAIEAGIPAQNADQVIDEVNAFINAQGKGAKFKPTLSQKVDDALIESSESELRRKTEYAQAFKDRDVLNIQAEQDALDALTDASLKPYSPSTVTEVAGGRVTRRVEQAKQIVADNTKRFDDQMAQIGRVKKEQVGEDTLNFLKARGKIESDAVDANWNAVRELGGYEPKQEIYNIDIPAGTRTKKLHEIFKRQASTARTTAGSPPSDVFLEGAKVTGRKNLPREEVINRQIARFEPSIREGKLEDLADYNREISRLKKKYRQITDNGTATDMDTTDLRRVIGSLEDDRTLALYKAGRRDLIRQIDQAEKATAAYHDKYKRSVVGDLTQLNKNGVPEIKSQSFVDNMLKRDVSEVDDFIGVIGDNPELQNQWKEGIANAYKRKVYTKTIKGVKQFNRESSNEFIDKNKHILDRFFSGSELDRLKNTGLLSEKLTNQIARFDKFKVKAEKLWGSGKLSKIDPDRLVRFVTDSEGSWITPKNTGMQDRLRKIKFVKNITKEYPGAWQSFQNDFKKQLKSNLVTDARTGRINPKKMAEWVSDMNKSAIIKNVMGKRYYDDLAKVNKVVQMLNKPMDKLAASEARRGWIQTIRAGAAPPLTKRGRALTALLTFGSDAGNKRTADAILNQDVLRQVADLAEHNAWTRQFFEKAASLGYMLNE